MKVISERLKEVTATNVSLEGTINLQNALLQDEAAFLVLVLNAKLQP